MKRYPYVGSREIARSSIGHSSRALAASPPDIIAWLRQSAQAPDASGGIVCTFIVDVSGGLWLADRRSEHVACAAGQPVLSAGEIAFMAGGGTLAVVSVTNQSLGYCPDPKSWPAVAAALDRLGLTHPGRFAPAYIIRACAACDTNNIIKDDIYECDICGSLLPR